jgi:hypothetical protein
MKHITGTITTIKTRLQAFAFPLATPTLVPVRVISRRRGAGMLEYALVALISIAVFGLLLTQFSNILEDLAKSIGDKLGVKQR